MDFFPNPFSKCASASKSCVCSEGQVPAPPARCGRSVRSDRNRTVKLSGMKQPHRKAWQKMCEEGGSWVGEGQAQKSCEQSSESAGKEFGL